MAARTSVRINILRAGVSGGGHLHGRVGELSHVKNSHKQQEQNRREQRQLQGRDAPAIGDQRQQPTAVERGDEGVDGLAAHGRTQGFRIPSP